MPSNAGRKPCDRRRKRNDCAPDIIVDRAEKSACSNTSQVHRENTTISFSDPRKQPEKEYELHLKKKLPSTVSKCQGKCGKRIKAEDKLVVKSFGKMTWTDLSTGQEKVRYGPMYIHFNEDCLKTFSDQFYAPGDAFDFSKIKIDSKSRTELNENDMSFLTGLGIQ